ncbi:MAG TPA: phosphohydrolase, partial [Vicinamibacteria bacterium]
MADPAGSHPPTHEPFLARLARGDWAGRALRVLLMAAVSSGAAWFLAPGANRLPGSEAIGTPAAQMVKADRDYAIVDEEATARRRVDAAHAERTVYLLDEGAAEEAAARVHAAFQLMRDEE